MQHFRRLAATIVLGTLIGAGIGAAPAGAQLPNPPSPLPADTAAAGAAPMADPMAAYTQRGVPAEATAENAVVARTRAIASAQRLAYERMASELGLPRGVSDSQIESMVSSIVVEQERTTRTGYTGRLTVNFNPNRAGGPGRSLASGGTAGAAPSDAAPPVMPHSGPAASHIEARARFLGLSEWLELRRRLAASPEIASVQIQAIAVDGARLRIGLRQGAEQAQQALNATGLALVPPAVTVPARPAGMLAPPVPIGGAALPVPAAPGATAGGAAGMWHIGLAGGA
ncbi:hypothetical protein [Pseudoroseomonas sp. WGS1072]|uniref:hypothetical protein n=1 Tax=Roseomonas sp. WGS1072 TaxID=3366816 RepID=UPI003BF34AB4